MRSERMSQPGADFRPPQEAFCRGSRPLFGTKDTPPRSPTFFFRARTRRDNFTPHLARAWPVLPTITFFHRHCILVYERRLPPSSSVLFRERIHVPGVSQFMAGLSRRAAPSPEQMTPFSLNGNPFSFCPLHCTLIFHIVLFAGRFPHSSRRPAPSSSDGNRVFYGYTCLPPPTKMIWRLEIPVTVNTRYPSLFESPFFFLSRVGYTAGPSA